MPKPNWAPKHLESQEDLTAVSNMVIFTTLPSKLPVCGSLTMLLTLLKPTSAYGSIPTNDNSVTRWVKVKQNAEACMYRTLGGRLEKHVLGGEDPLKDMTVEAKSTFISSCNSNKHLRTLLIRVRREPLEKSFKSQPISTTKTHPFLNDDPS